MNSEVYSTLVSAQIQSSAAKVSTLTVPMDYDPKYTAKVTRELLKTKNWNVLKWLCQSPDFNPTELLFIY